ncbi:hypothetical protein C8R46DRAFT_1354026 [Mycena filopes]|nr:hypothetical protein C8R46DRAFT_1354026 [Mycena filopes]
MFPSESFTSPEDAPPQIPEDPLHERTLAEYEYLERKVSDLQLDSKLPPELLVKIFLLCTLEIVALPPSADEPLLILTRICRRWRELALLTPELWANISVVFVQEGQHKMDWVTTVSSQWLSRAGPEYPLCVTAKCAAAYATTLCDNPELVAPFVSMVISHARHLRSIALELPFAVLSPLFALPSDTFPRLEKMSLEPMLRAEDMFLPGEGSLPQWHWPSTAVVLNSAPRIQEVKFGPSVIHHGAPTEILEAATNIDDSPGSGVFFAPNLTLPWSKLSVVAFPATALTPKAWCSILRECRKLTYLELCVRPSPNVDGTTLGEDHQVQLDHLTSLTITAIGSGDLLLDRLTAPRLNVVIIMGTGLPLASFLSFQRRSDFRLETFMPFCSIPAADVESVFEHLPDLRELCIFTTPTDHFPESLWRRVGRTELLPHLKTLMIRPTAHQAPVLIDMIAARWEAGGPLEVAFADVRPAHLEGVTEELRRLDKYTGQGQSAEICDAATWRSK